MTRFWTPFALVALLLALFVSPLAADEEPAQPEEEPAGADEAEIQRTKQLVADLRELTAEIRGLEWKKPFEATLLTRAQVRKKMMEDVKKELPPEELEAITRILRRLGMLGPDENPLTIYMDMITGTAGGFFDPEEKQLFLIAGQDPESQKPVIIHELIHALEDQYIDLKTTQESMEKDPDRLFAFKCMIEGSAEIAREVYEERFPEESRKFHEGMSKNTELQAGNMRALAKTPAYMMLGTMLHYRTGPDFVGQALAKAGKTYAAGMDGLYEKQPVSQEQVLHPEKYLGEQQDWPQTIVWGGDLAEAAGEGWSQLDEYTQGEIDLAFWLDYHLGPDEGKLDPRGLAAGIYLDAAARTAAEGWDAGKQVYLDKDGDHLAVVSAFAFDTQRDAQEAFDAILATLKKADSEFAETERKTATDEDQRAAVDFTSSFGKGRLVRRGQEILVLDGMPDETFERVWEVVAKTTFVKDARDTWDPATAKDPFDGFQIVDRNRGLGLKLPNDQWRENAQMSAALRNMSPAFVTVVDRSTISMQVITIDQGATRANLPGFVKMFLQQMGIPNVDLSRSTPTEVMGRDGFMYDLAQPKQQSALRLYAGSDGQRTTFVFLRGGGDDVTNLEGEINEIIGGMKSVLSY